MKTPFLALLLLGSCVVPTIDEVERTRLLACDDAHPCRPGTTCVGGFCRLGNAPVCMPGEMRPCGSDVGECRPGVQHCDAGQFDSCMGGVRSATESCDGRDNDCDGVTDNQVVSPACELTRGVCVGAVRACADGGVEPICGAASYGPTFEAGSETRCDGLDNDCDGVPDDNLPTMACELNTGACLGATRSCVQARYPPCTAAEYIAAGRGYEALERSCDGVDNDCDGMTDVLPASLLSDAGVVAQRAVVAAFALMGAQTERDVMVFYEAGPRVVSRLLSGDGSLTPPRFPSTSVTAVTRARAPSLASSPGGQVYAAWFEELQTPLYRVVVGTINRAGESTVQGSPGVSVTTSTPGPGVDLEVGVGSAVVLVHSWADAGTPTATTLQVTSCPAALDQACGSVSLGSGSNPSVLVDASTAFIAYESPAGLRLAKLAIPPSGPATVTSNVVVDANERAPSLSGTASDLVLHSAVRVAPFNVVRRRGDCTGACPPSGFSPPTALFPLSSQARWLRTIDQVIAGENGAEAWWWSQPRGVVRVATSGARPVPLVPGAKLMVFYDTGGAAYSRRFCQ